MCKIADFGLARLIEDNEYTARQGKLPGIPYKEGGIDKVSLKRDVICGDAGMESDGTLKASTDERNVTHPIPFMKVKLLTPAPSNCL